MSNFWGAVQIYPRLFCVYLKEGEYISVGKVRGKTIFYVQYHSQVTNIACLYGFTAGITKMNNKLYLFSIREKSFFR